MPDTESRPPCVVVLHEVWGPDANIERVCKRLRKLGFATTAPDLYQGHESLLTPRNIRRAMEAVWCLSLQERHDKRKLAAEVARKGADDTTREVLYVIYDHDFRERMFDITLEAIRAARRRHGRVATLGFSLGGGLSLLSATSPVAPNAAVAYCGEPPGAESLKGAKTPLLAICASHDELMNPLMPTFVEASLNQGVDLTVRTFPGTEHDFFNKTMKDRYNRAAAEEAWALTAWFLTRALRGGHPLSKR